ncbi:MAG: hypothetical protein HKN58_04200, partial [Xanthomonadales bacterium]|nr:hypothetical protein [Xanthomonadales bacterium]
MLRAFINEVRQREVLRVVAVYAVVAWVILQVAGVVIAPLGIPEWVMRALIIAAIVGFPIVFFLAWVIRIEAEGLFFDLPLWRGISGERVVHKNDSVVVGALAALLVIAAYSIGVRVFDNIPDQDSPPGATQEFLGAPNSIAVLSFEPFSDSGADRYFSAGLAEEILNRLASLKELDVAARSSSFQFRGQQYDARDVARKLVVRNLLDGSVRRHGDRIRVSVQLVDGANGFNLWNETFDRDLQDIFAVQEDIATGVVAELKIALSLDSERELHRKPTDSLAAYDAYLRAIEQLRSPADQEVMRAAVAYFAEALQFDPAFARAHAGLCEAHLSLYEMNRDSDDFDAANAACDMAAELDPG